MKLRFIILGVLIAAGGVTLAWQWRTRVLLQVEAERLQAETREFHRLRDENRRLASAQVSATELENLREDRAEVVQLREKIDDLTRRIAETAPTPAGPEIPAPAAVLPNSGPLPAAAWKNAGQATPQATLETALWAAKTGDINALVDMIALDERARVKAQLLLDSLPDATRAQYTTPEQLIASLTARDVPLTSMRVAGVIAGTDDTQLIVNLPTQEQPERITKLALHRYADGWRLKVPESAVDKYSQTLTGAPIQLPATGP